MSTTPMIDPSITRRSSVVPPCGLKGGTSWTFLCGSSLVAPDSWRARFAIAPWDSTRGFNRVVKLRLPRCAFYGSRCGSPYFLRARTMCSVPRRRLPMEISQSVRPVAAGFRNEHSIPSTLPWRGPGHYFPWRNAPRVHFWSLWLRRRTIGCSQFVPDCHSLVGIYQWIFARARQMQF